jgi:DNA-binding XRE family transcriptional regulator
MRSIVALSRWTAAPVAYSHVTSTGSVSGARTRRMSAEGFVYAIESDGLIKLGWSADPIARATKIASDNPHPIRILGVIPGGKEVETQLHHRFAAFIVRGEWFALPDEARREIENSWTVPIRNRVAPENALPLRKFRIAAGRTLADLAEQVGVVPSHLSQIETGQRTPSLGLASRLAAFTGISIDKIAAFDKSKDGAAA